jgi:hypothetical protein
LSLSDTTIDLILLSAGFFLVMKREGLRRLSYSISHVKESAGVVKTKLPTVERKLVKVVISWCS